jgi:CheY-like chemotaxis protein
MHTIMIVGANPGRMKAIADAVQADGAFDLQWVDHGAQALAAASVHAPQAVVIDEALSDMTGLELVRRLLRVNALINTAVVSGLAPEAFHETSEGLGILAQLPTTPTPQTARDLLQRIKRMTGLTAAEHFIASPKV